MSDPKYKSGLARFFAKLDPIGRFVLPKSIGELPTKSADFINKQGHFIAKNDPIIAFDRKSGSASWTKEGKKISDWAYDHPGDATAISVGAAVGAGAAGGAAGGGTGAAGGAGAVSGGSTAVSGGIGGAIDAAIPTVTVTGSAGGGGGAVAAGAGAAAAGAGAAASGGGGSGSSNSSGSKWADYAKNIGGNLQQQGQQQQEAAIDALARTGPPPGMGGGTNVGPVPIDQYQQALAQNSTPQKVFGA